MALTIEDLLTREEIRDTLNDYSQGLDQRNWELFDRVWTPDATVEAPDEGIDTLPASELKARLISRNDPDRLSGQHLLNNTHFQIDGDHARTITEVTWVTLQTTDDGISLTNDNGTIELPDELGHAIRVEVLS